MYSTKLVILGRDGILNVYRDSHVTAPEEWHPIPGALEAVARLNHAGWHTVVATNQAGIGRGVVDMASVNAVHAHMNQKLMVQGGRIDAVFFCPHAPNDDCDCRKPKPGMMKEIGRRYGVDLVNVAMVGDTLRDLQAAAAAGCEPHLVRTGRAEKLDDAAVQVMLTQVPAAKAHASLAAFVEFMLARHRYVDSAAGSLRT